MDNNTMIQRDDSIGTDPSVVSVIDTLDVEPTVTNNNNQSVTITTATGGGLTYNTTDQIALSNAVPSASDTGKFTVTSTETFTDDKVEGIMQPITKTGYDYKVTGKDITLTFSEVAIILHALGSPLIKALSPK